MNLEHGTITQIARRANLPLKTVWAYCNGTRRPRYERAKQLEAGTGIDALVWLKGDSGEIRKALESLELKDRL